jgi:hypothetical protein
LVVLAEPAGSGWHAAVNGKSLVAKTAYGWAQGFVLPTTGGRLTVGYSGGVRDGWLAAELVVVLLVIGAMLPGRRPDGPLDDSLEGETP